jgi:hypothetical protein
LRRSRRGFVAGTTSGGGFSPSGAVDLNTIPTSLIKRTEVVTGGAQPRFVGPQIVIHRDNAYISPALATLMDTNGVTSFVLNRIGEDFGHQTGLLTQSLSWCRGPRWRHQR